MLDLGRCKIVKQGIMLYDNALEYSVIIVESSVLYGSGDFEDPPEIANDRESLCYYAWCDSPSRRNEFCSGWHTAFMSVDEAMNAIEKETYFLHWIN